MKIHLTHPSIGTFAIQLHPGSCLVLGRDTAEADLELPWDPRISRSHARIWMADEQCWFEDLGSRNGSWLYEATEGGPESDSPRQLAEAVALTPEMRIVLGDTTLQVGSAPNPWAEVTETEQPSGLPEALLALSRSKKRPDDTKVLDVETDRPLVRFTGTRRVRIEGHGLQALWREELSRGRLFVPASPSTALERGTRVTVELNTKQGFYELQAVVVHVGAGPLGISGVGLSVSIADRLHAAFDAGLDKSSSTTIEIEAPVELTAPPAAAPLRVDAKGPLRPARMDPELKKTASLRAQRFVGLVAIDRLYEALGIAPEATDAEVRQAVVSWSKLVSTETNDASLEELRDPLGRALAMVESQLTEPVQRLRYDFAHGHVYPERRKVLAERGEGPPMTVLASSWRRAFPARSERARRLWAAAEQATLSGRIEEARQLRAQARSLAPFQH